MSELPIRVAIIEDLRLTREGLATLIDGSEGFAVSGSYASMEAALADLEDCPDVLLLDNGLPGMSGVQGVGRLRERFPQLPILMLTVFSDAETVFEAICSGATGYLLKETPPVRLLESIREVLAGGAPMSPPIARKVVAMFHRVAPQAKAVSPLSARESEVLQFFSQGHSYKSCAAAMHVSVDTVRSHIRNIYEKLHVHSKSEAVRLAMLAGWVL